MIITCYYNPCGYKTRYENYLRFKEELNAPLLTIECAFGDEPFTLKDSIKLRADSVLWQKERLLRIAETFLPHDQDYVIWADCDIIFENLNWIEDTRKILQEENLCQPFQTIFRLNPDGTIEKNEEGRDNIWDSFGYKYKQGVVSNWFDVHGHTGFVWASRRDKFDLYDRAIGGTADHLMAHAAVGQIPFMCIDKAYKGKMAEHFYEWALGYQNLIQGKLGFVEGEIYHLWHGSLENRKYLPRTIELANLEFNPYTDLKTNEEGLLEFNNRDDIQKWVLEYFETRKEDG